MLQRVPRSEKRFHSCHQDRHYPSRVYKLHRPKQLAFARQLCGLPPCCCVRCLVLPTWRTRRRLYNRSLPVCRVFPILAYKRQQEKKNRKQANKTHSAFYIVGSSPQLLHESVRKINPPTRQDRNQNSYDIHSRNKSTIYLGMQTPRNNLISILQQQQEPLPFLPFQEEADRQQSDLFSLNSKKKHTKCR